MIKLKDLLKDGKAPVDLNSPEPILKNTPTDGVDGYNVNTDEIAKSLKESNSNQIRIMSALTGIRKSALASFIDDNDINGTSLLDFIKTATVGEKSKIISAIAGKPNNKFKKQTVNKFKRKFHSNMYEATTDTYFKTASAAADYARNLAEKKGFDIDESDWDTQITHGGSYGRLRPSVGKTNSFTVGLSKNGKPQRKALSISLYGMDSGKFELTSYIN